MTYYTKGSMGTRNTLARAELLDAQLQAIEDGFNLLPDSDAVAQGRITYAADSGTANAYAVTLSPVPSSYVAGLEVTFRAANANTGASTLNVNALGTKAIQIWDGSALSANTILANQIVTVVYDGTAFRITSLHGGTNIATLAAISADIVVASGISGSITAAAGNATNINTVAGSISDVNALGPIALDLAALAAVIGDIEALADIEDGTTATGALSSLGPQAANVALLGPLATELGLLADIQDGTIATGAITGLAAIAGDVTTCAVNIADIQNAGGLFGNVVAGPVSTTDGFVPLWDGTAGDALKVGYQFADDAALRAGTANRPVLAANLVSAAAFVTLTDDTTITPDFNAGRNFTVTLGGNRTLANPTNQTAGQSGIIEVIQDGTGSRTLSYGSAWDFSPGGAPTLTTTANAVDMIAYYVKADGTIRATFAAEFA